MLNQVLQEFESSQGTVSLDELSRRLQIESGALEGMLQFWVRKGRIQVEGADSEAALAEAACSTGSCSGGCPGPVDCPFVASMPRIYAIKKD